MAGKPDTKARNESAPIVISDWRRQKEIAELAYQFWGQESSGMDRPKTICSGQIEH